MKSLLRIVFSVVVLTFVVMTPAMAYEDNDVVCNVNSLIKGNVSQGANTTETALGDIAADALLNAGDADVAIVNGGELKSNIFAGTCKWSDILGVFEENKNIAVAEVTSAQLWNLLEHGIGFTVLGADQKTDSEASAFAGFPQVAGIEFEYDPTAPVGERIKYILVGGTEVKKGDTETTFTLCATEFMLSGGYGYDSYEYASLNMGLADALAEYLKSETLSATTIASERITTLGSNDEPLIPRGVVFIIGLFGCMCCFLFNKAKKKVDPDRTLYSFVDPNR